MRAVIALGVVTAATAAWLLPGPASAQAPTPVFATSVELERVSGSVFVTVPGGHAREQVSEARLAPIGSTVDASAGTVRVTSADAAGKQQYGDFYEGAFRVLQPRNGGGLVELRLAGGDFSACTSAHAATTAKAGRHLWGKAHGRFRTKGRYAAATVRGTTWQVADECRVTRVFDQEGQVQASTEFQSYNLEPGETEVGYCFPHTAVHKRRKYCIAVRSAPLKQIVTFGIGVRGSDATRYRLCVYAPSGRTYCDTYPLERYKHTNIKVGVAGCEQHEGPGNYVAKWYVHGRQLGVPLEFTMTEPHPPFDIGCF